MGKAILRDGRTMDYKEYLETPDWQRVRHARFRFDEGKCVVCHKQFNLFENYNTHHMDYARLGQEHMRDVITLCESCHAKFHNAWTKNQYWKGRESGHWNAFSLEHTANICVLYAHEDKLICKDVNAPNLCSVEETRKLILRYSREYALNPCPMIDTHDIELYIRNKRWELFFEAEQRGLNVEQFLDEYYGAKVRGQNPIRQLASTYYKRHKPSGMHMHYNENPNINRLMNFIKEREEKL